MLSVRRSRSRRRASTKGRPSFGLVFSYYFPLIFTNRKRKSDDQSITRKGNSGLGRSLSRFGGGSGGNCRLDPPFPATSIISKGFRITSPDFELAILRSA